MDHRAPYKAKIAYIIRDSTSDDLYRFRRIYARQATVLANSYVESEHMLKLAYQIIESCASVGEYRALGVRLTIDSMNILKLDGFSVKVTDLTDKNLFICTIGWPGDLFVTGVADCATVEVVADNSAVVSDTTSTIEDSNGSK